MNKSLKLLAAATLIALTTAACQKEKLFDSQTAGEETVTFTVKTDAAATKATADNDGLGAGLTRCLVAVYMKTGDPAQPYKLYDTPATTGSGLNYTFTVNLIRKQTYQIVVWADKGETVYDVNKGLTLVTRKTDDVACNSDAYDAFYASTEFVQGTTTSTAITAKRPFAQLNLITKDLNKNFQPGAVTVTYSSPQSFNPFDGSVSDMTEVTYKADSPYYNPTTVTTATQHTLVMNYLFAAEGDQTILPSVKMTAKLTVDAEIEVANVPVRRNYRTNIIGNLLTEQTDFTITVDPAWSGATDVEWVSVATVAKANEALQNGKTNVAIESVETDGSVIEIPQTNASIGITLPSNNAKAVTIKYKTSSESGQTPNLNVAAENNTGDLVINAPQSHVTLNGATYNNVTASTSNNTLVVGSDVTVKTLTIEAGSAVIYGKVTKLVKGENAGKIEWHVTTSSSMTNALKVADKIVLEKAIKPIIQSSSFTIDRDVTIDLNGFSLKATNCPLKITKGNVNIIGRGELIGAYSMLLKGSKDDIADYCVVNLGPDVVLKASSCGIIINPPASSGYDNYGIVVNSEAQIISGAASSIGITINGSNKETGENVPKFNITGGKIDATVGIYAAGYAEWNLSNCEVEGDLTAIEIRAGKMTIDGGAYTSNKDPFDVEPNGSGTTTEGAALGISQHTTDLPIEVVVNGGTFKGAYAIWEKDVQNDVARDRIKLTVNNGTFNGAIYTENCGQCLLGGTYDDASALDYMGNYNGNIDITMARDGSITTSNFYLNRGGANTSTITVDGNGHTLTFNSTYRNHIQTTNNAKIVLKNVTMDSNYKVGGSTWDDYGLIFDCPTEFTDVTFNRQLVLSQPYKHILNNVTINQTASTGDMYALWIEAGADVTFNGGIVNAINPNSGSKNRAIKIADEYITDPQLTKLNVSGVTFKSQKKAAVLVTSTAGADIIWGTGNDISDVFADQTNAVWNDAGRTAAWELITVTGCAKYQEQ